MEKDTAIKLLTELLGEEDEFAQETQSVQDTCEAIKVAIAMLKTGEYPTAPSADLNAQSSSPEAPRKVWKVPCAWGMMGYLMVEAENKEDAMDAARNMVKDCALPENGSYLEDSFEIDEGGTPFLAE